MGRLSVTSLHFICCMKPNTLKQPGLFDAPMVLAQLRYAGLLELCRFRKVSKTYALRSLTDSRSVLELRHEA